MPHSIASVPSHAGAWLAQALATYGVRFLFTLCGGHISPILVGAKQHGLRVIDVRHEATAVFAADAVSRLTGVPGVAAVTAGPGLTNTITALKNAQLAQSPLILLGGATATMLKGRGSLQDIDQIALVRPHVKWYASLKKLKDLPEMLAEAFRVAQADVPGPVFLELPVDLLYPAATVQQWYQMKSPKAGENFSKKLQRWYLQRHVKRLFQGAEQLKIREPQPLVIRQAGASELQQVVKLVAKAQRPVLVVGSQAMLEPSASAILANAVAALRMPTYLSGMARGLLGRNHPLKMRHYRKQALQEADLVILAGVPCDFRLDYGAHLGRQTLLVMLNRDADDLARNRRPQVGIQADPGQFLLQLSEACQSQAAGWHEWIYALEQRELKRQREIGEQAQEQKDYLNPIWLFQELEEQLAEDSVIVADGGDFVATASYILEPRQPLSWLDPGVFGTLGVGAGFALGAKLCRPHSEVWIIYGDGAAGYSLIEWDTFVRHQIPVIGLIGNDREWRQIARDQVEIFQDDVGTALRPSAYHLVAQGLGAEGFVVEDPADFYQIVQRAKALSREGRPVLINALIEKTEFRKGSISM